MMHRKMAKRFKRNRVQVDHIDEQWDVGLMDMNYCSKHNNGTSFILLAIDIFSRYAWAVPLQNKQATTVKKGFDVLLDKSKGRTPQKVCTDPGGEFANGIMKKWFDDHDILHSVTHNEMKANYVEKLIKTIKSKIVVKYFNLKKLTSMFQSINQSINQFISICIIPCSVIYIHYNILNMIRHKLGLYQR